MRYGRVIVSVVLPVSFLLALYVIFQFKRENGKIDPVAEYIKSADLSSPESQYRIGCNYYSGSAFFPEDHKEAVKWFKKAAEEGYRDAFYMLGDIYSEGDFSSEPDSKVQAFRYYWKAAELGNLQAMCEMGRCFMNGEGVEPDPSAALVWYEKAALQGYDWAEFSAGFAYLRGQGTKPDKAKAEDYFKKALSGKNPHIQFFIAELYAKGDLGGERFDEAVELYKSAASQGLSWAEGVLNHLRSEDKLSDSDK